MNLLRTIILAAIPLFVLGGCYTQLGSTRGEYDAPRDYHDYSVGDEEVSPVPDDSLGEDYASDQGYEDARQQFYDNSSYAPSGVDPWYGPTIGISAYSPYWLNPWDPWGYYGTTGGWFFPHYGYGYRPGYYQGYGFNRYWSSHPSYAHGSYSRPSANYPAPIGRTRGAGSTGRSVSRNNGYGAGSGYYTTPGGGSSMPVLPNGGSRAPAVTGRSGAAAPGGSPGAGNARRGTSGGSSSNRPAGHNRGSSSGSTRSQWTPPPSAPPSAPAYTPPPSPPPAPASAPASSGNRGGSSTSGSSSGSSSSSPGGHHR